MTSLFGLGHRLQNSIPYTRQQDVLARPPVVVAAAAAPPPPPPPPPSQNCYEDRARSHNEKVEADARAVFSITTVFHFKTEEQEDDKGSFGIYTVLLARTARHTRLHSRNPESKVPYMTVLD